jgi:hypothetical protein
VLAGRLICVGGVASGAAEAREQRATKEADRILPPNENTTANGGQKSMYYDA